MVLDRLSDGHRRPGSWRRRPADRPATESVEGLKRLPRLPQRLAWVGADEDRRPVLVVLDAVLIRDRPDLPAFEEEAVSFLEREVDQDRRRWILPRRRPVPVRQMRTDRVR